MMLLLPPPLHPRHLLLVLLVGCSIFVARARGDALVVTKAMQATTVAEIHVTASSVRVELEIGVADLKAFADLLPDEIHAALNVGKAPLPERLSRFFRDGLVVRDEAGASLVGRVESVAARRRIFRDEITGEPLPVQPADAEPIVFATLVYEFQGQPKSLTFQSFINASVAANIGFVCYHHGLPVNDFRYLSEEITLDLDWRDPWYSRFRHPNLRRQFDAPLAAFLYVEPYEVRQEIIVRPRDLQAWLDLGIGDSRVIPVDAQGELKERVAEFLAEKNPVTIDGRPAEGRLDRIHFIRRTLRRTGIIEPPEELDATSATLGVIFVYPIDRLPEEVSMTWELFSPAIQVVPAVASDEAGGLPSRVTPDEPVLTWRNYLTNPTVPQLASIAPPPSQREFRVPIVTVICGGVIVVLLLKSWKTSSDGSAKAFAATLALFVCGVLAMPYAKLPVTSPFASSPGISGAEARELVTGLLHNVYRAFDHHDESLIYDRLAHSIAGDLLAEVYLETRRSMEVKNQGGLRITVKEISVSELEPITPQDESALGFRCRWRVAGWIGHWGHIHSRVNEHLANLTIAPLEGRWKITAIEMLDEQPIETPRVATTAP